MNWRRVLSFCSVLVLVLGLALPVSAAENEVVLDFTYTSIDGNYIFFCPSDFVPSFDVPLSVDLYVSIDGSFLYYASSDLTFYEDEGTYWSQFDQYFIFGCSPGFAWVCGTDQTFGSDTVIRLVVKSSAKEEYTSVLSYVFNWVISWVGSIFEAVTVGPLTALGSILAVGISVSALFVALSYFFRIWRL